MATQTSFGSDGYTSFGSGEGALGGPTKFSGSQGIAATTGGQQAQPKFRKEYGLRLTSDQVGEIGLAEADFQNRLQQYSQEVEQNVAQAREVLGAEQGDFNVRYQAGKKDVDKAKSAIQKGFSELQRSAKNATVDGMFNQWYKREKTPIRVVGNGKVEGTYYLPRAAIEHIAEQKGLNGSWVDKGKAFNIDVEQQGRIRGQELHDDLRRYSQREYLSNEFAKNPEVQKQHAKAQQELNKAAKELQKANSKVQDAERDLVVAKSDATTYFQGGDVELEGASNRKDKEIAKSKNIAERQKKDRAEMYGKWYEARQKAYQALGKMEF